MRAPPSYGIDLLHTDAGITVGGHCWPLTSWIDRVSSHGLAIGVNHGPCTGRFLNYYTISLPSGGSNGGQNGAAQAEQNAA
jgi:hypothetical protein